MSDKSRYIWIDGKVYRQIGFTSVIPQDGKTYGIRAAGDYQVAELVPIVGGGPVPSAEDIPYKSDICSNVQEALDLLLYQEPQIVSFTGGGNFEIGSIVKEVKLSWVLNKTVVYIALNQGIGSLNPADSSYTDKNRNITQNRTYTLTISDGKMTKTADTLINFLPKRYWGVSEKPELTNADILAMDSELSDTRVQEKTFDCSGGKYFYFVIKKSYCDDIKFKISDLMYSAVQKTPIMLINAHDYEDEYLVIRSLDIQTGSKITVEVL